MEGVNNEKDRDFTTKRLLDAVGEIIIKDGFDKVGVNAIASKAGVSKVLIYRYFGSVDNMIVEYLSQDDLLTVLYDEITHQWRFNTEPG